MELYRDAGQPNIKCICKCECVSESTEINMIHALRLILHK